MTNSSPIIHLAEINAEEIWSTFPSIIIPDIVIDEISYNNKPGTGILKNKCFKVSETNDEILKISEKILKEYKIGKNDSIILGHSIYHRSKYIFTDDLELRKISKIKGVHPVGTIGILLRSLRIGYYDKTEVIELLDCLLNNSSLYISKTFIDDVKKIVIGYNKKTPPTLSIP